MAGSRSTFILFSFSLGILLFLLGEIIPAEASLYPTKPITNTTYIAGQAALVTWVEDGIKPLLASLGRMRIDLYAGNNVSLANGTLILNGSIGLSFFWRSYLGLHLYSLRTIFWAGLLC